MKTVPTKPRLAISCWLDRAAVARRRRGRLEVELRRLERVELGVIGQVRGPVEDREADCGEADQLGTRRVGDARRPERHVQPAVVLTVHPDHAGVGAVRQALFGSRRITNDREPERLLPGCLVDALRRVVEHGVDDADGALAEGGVHETRSASWVTVRASR